MHYAFGHLEETEDIVNDNLEWEQKEPRKVS
jgi:hypothetical protein